MTLQKLLTEISQMAIGQKIINFSEAGADIYRLNGTIEDWPVLFTSPTGMHNVGVDTTVYGLTLYYLDRLLNDGSNDIEIISTAIEQLKNIVRGIEGIEGVVTVEDEYEVMGFTDTEAFNDSVAGAYATIRVEVVNDSICYQE